MFRPCHFDRSPAHKFGDESTGRCHYSTYVLRNVWDAAHQDGAHSGVLGTANTAMDNRLRALQSNAELVHTHNSNGEKSYTVELNRFAYWSQVELLD